MFDPYAEILKLPKSGAGLPLDRLSRTFADLWEAIAASGTKVVHVVGSNGKGSTAAFLDRLLRRLGLRTGLYTSPHYFRFGERIQIDGELATEADLEWAWNYFEQRAHPLELFGGFEAMTVMAAALFAREPRDVLVIEAGIGGRYDPTRLFGGSLALLTSVDLEHTAILGRSLEEIAADKMDVTAPGGTVLGGWLEPGLSRFCETYGGLAGHRFEDVSADYEIDAGSFASTLSVGVSSPAFARAGVVEYRTPSGYFVRNSILALRGAERLLGRDAGDALLREFAPLCREFAMPGRFENLESEPLLFCDVAHTPGAIRDVIESCRRLFSDPPVFVLGMSVDKDYPGMCRLLGGYGTRFLTFPAAHKGQAPETLATELRSVNASAAIECFATARAVAEHVLGADFPASMPIVATGGLFSSMEFRTVVRGGDPSALHFY